MKQAIRNSDLRKTGIITKLWEIAGSAAFLALFYTAINLAGRAVELYDASGGVIIL